MFNEIGIAYRVFVGLEEEDGNDPDAVDHEEGKGHLVLQF